MKFCIGTPSENPEFTPDDSWQPLKEPGVKTFVWLAVPIGVFTTVAFGILWLGLTPQSWVYFKYWSVIENSFVDIVIVSIALAVIHELIHAVFHPGYGLSSQTVFGLWLSKGSFYAYWDGEWGRNRALACFLAPFFVLSVVPLLVCMMQGEATLWLDDDAMAMLCFVSIFNAFASCADLMGARLIFRQIPAEGVLRNRCYYTYWRHGENE